MQSVLTLTSHRRENRWDAMRWCREYVRTRERVLAPWCVSTKWPTSVKCTSSVRSSGQNRTQSACAVMCRYASIKWRTSVKCMLSVRSSDQNRARCSCIVICVPIKWRTSVKCTPRVRSSGQNRANYTVMCVDKMTKISRVHAKCMQFWPQSSQLRRDVCR